MLDDGLGGGKKRARLLALEPRHVLQKHTAMSVTVAALSWRSLEHLADHRTPTVREAIVALTVTDRGNPLALGLDIGYPSLAEDGWNFGRPLYLQPVKWEDWIDLPIRDFDFTISTARKQIRVPTVIVAANHNRMPMTEPRVSREALYHRGGGVCQYTGEFIDPKATSTTSSPRRKGKKHL